MLPSAQVYLVVVELVWLPSLFLPHNLKSKGYFSQMYFIWSLSIENPEAGDGDFVAN